MAKVKGARRPRQEAAARYTAAPDATPSVRTPTPLWLWPLLGALLLAPLRAGQMERVPVAAVNALISLALLLRAAMGRPDAEEPAVVPASSRARLLTPGVWLGLFLALNALSLGVSIYPHATLTALLDLAAWFSAFWLVARGGGGRRVIGWVLAALLLAGAVAAVQALAEYAGHAWIAGNVSDWRPDPGWRAFGPFFNPNLLAATSILLTPVALALMLRAERPVERAVAGAGALLLIAALLVSGSRGGTLALLVGGVGFWGIAATRGLWPDRGRLIALGALILALLPLVWLFRVPMLGRLAHIPGTPALAPGSPAAGASQRSNTFRWLTWRATAKIVAARPVLGTGAGTFEFALPRYALVGYTQRAHQSYLQIAAEAGVPALLAWLVALGLVLARLLSPRHGARDWLLPGIGAGLLAAMAHNAVDYSWSVPGTALPFWAFLGAAVGLTTPSAANHLADRGSSPVRASNTRSPERLICGIAGLLLLVLNGVWLQAAERQDEGRLALQAGDPRAAVEAYQSAAGLAPLDAGLQVDLAGAQAAAGDTDAAQAALRQATRLAPIWGRPYHRLGRVLEHLGRLSEAATAFRAAAERDPRNTQPLEALSKLLQAQGDDAGAQQVCQRIIAIAEDPNSQYYALDGMTDPIPAACYDTLGRDAERRGRGDEGIHLFSTGAERLRRWRLERPWRASIRDARGESGAGRELEFQRLEVSLWERLADLYRRSGQTSALEAALDEARAARAAAQGLIGL